MRPLKFCFQRPADAPVGVAEMVVDRCVTGLDLCSPLQFVDGIVEAVEAEIGPAERIDDVAVIRLQLDRATQRSLVELSS